MRKFFKEFGEFIKRGSVLDLAVGMIIGTAFNAIVKSLVNDVLMPLVGLAVGGSVSEAKLVLIKEVTEPDALGTGLVVVDPEVAIYYGRFIQSIIDFLLIALTIFIIVKIVSGLRARREKLFAKKQAEVAPVEPEVVVPEVTTNDILLEIRDLLKKEE